MPHLYDMDIDINFRVGISMVREENNLSPEQLAAIILNMPMEDVAKIVAEGNITRMDICGPEVWNEDDDPEGSYQRRYGLNTTPIEPGLIGATSINDYGETDREWEEG